MTPKIHFILSLKGNILQPETIVLNVSGRVLMVNREINGNASEQLVSNFVF